MESLISFQDDLAKRITKATNNFKKSPKERLTRDYVESRLESLEQLWSDFRQGHKELLQTADSKLLSAQSYIATDVYEQTEEKFTNHKCELKKFLSSFKVQSSLTQSVVNNERETSKATLVKLPKITIPSFSGKYTEWTTFRDLFVSLIHKNAALDNVQKLQYLKGFLTGEAEQLIRYIPVSDANYELCWKQLEARFSNKKYISHCILKRLLSQRNISSESAGSLKELMDTSSDCLSALTNLGVDVSTWDIIVIHLLSLKLDPESRKQWELHVTTNVASDALPTFVQFKDFLTSRYRALEFIETKVVNKPIPSSSKFSTNNKAKVLHATNVTKINCEFCGDEHKLCFCKQFISQNYEKRHEFVKNNKICYNCLGSNHSVRFCQKATTCRICKKKHHSLLHPGGAPAAAGNTSSSVQPIAEASGMDVVGGTSTTGSSRSSNEITPVVTCFSKGKSSNQVLLPTALVSVESKTGQYRPIRALLDQGSQASFVTEATVQSLGLRKTAANLTISGVGGNQKSMKSKSAVTLNIQSFTDPNFKMEIKCFILTNITTLLPDKGVSVPEWVQFENLCLADPNFNSPNKIDMLLGAEVYSQIIREGVLRGPVGPPVAQFTSLGWILSGPMGTTDTANKISVLHAHVNENDVLKSFWELENEPLLSTPILTKDEQKCEDLFAATTRRDEHGRYVVKLPFREDVQPWNHGESRKIAIKRLESLERKFAKDKVLQERYTEVINEYLELGHMVLVPKLEVNKEPSVYLPHHAVVREDKSTTKVRVVFDASCKYANGISLNDTLMVGPTLQPDLRHLIMSWRKHPVCLVADIEKMYRMVKVAEEDCDFQRIVWRNQSSDEILDYKLLVVTFGTASAPYLAVKALMQVAVDYKEKYPLAATRVAKEFYMDDLMTGCQTIEDGLELYQEMNALLKEGGFVLQKWSSNKNELLKMIDQREEREGEDIGENKNLEFNKDNIVKILGLTWNRNHDEFQYSVKLAPLTAPVTKRKIISDVARLFDPLGWIAPCVIKAKIFIQRLWLAGTEWDEEPPISILEDWYTYRNELSQLTDYRIPRWLSTKDDDAVVELHGFADASNVAYAAVVYVRVVDASGTVHVVLIGAKTRVAPVRQISIPRLELCGAVLLAKLLVEIAEVLQIPRNKVRAWTDSTVVLAWLNKHPSNWKTFVANRISEIHSTLEPSQWSHVSTKNNPADCASRGVQPSELADLDLWKFGPKFLWDKEVRYKELKNNDTHEEQSSRVHAAVVEVSILDKYSSLNKLIRVVAYCRRFITKKKIFQNQQSADYLNKWELTEALTSCIKLSQAEFEAEIKEIKTYGQVKSKSSKLLSLNPFIDDKGLLRVNGRISHSQETDDVKQPILLPHRSRLSDLIVDDAHKKTLHGDATLMLNFIRTAYWIIGAKNLVKHHVRKCVICVRHKAKLQTQLMGSLPAVRVTPAKAFLSSGVDYAGPIMLRTSKGRGHKAYKGYVCLFVCMVTKAIHLEVVSDLTSRGFLEAFKRFVARRGHCADIYSDNGTNFVGASKELKDMVAVEKSTMAKEIADSLAGNGTSWHFIPPRAPNFGGLWESGIKSTKYHIKRVIGDSTLTYEEMSTLLAQIEACLNSRPLSVVGNDPEEARPLTPGHFLVGEPLLTVPEANYDIPNLTSLKRWQVTQGMLQNFWRRWSREYLTHLMHRYKWSFKIPEPSVGDIVLVKEDDLPPSKWLFGRIITKHFGLDGLTRVVSLKCKNSIIKRPTSKLCVLPINV